MEGGAQKKVKQGTVMERLGNRVARESLLGVRTLELNDTYPSRERAECEPVRDAMGGRV